MDVSLSVSSDKFVTPEWRKLAQEQGNHSRPVSEDKSIFIAVSALDVDRFQLPDNQRGCKIIVFTLWQK